MSQDWILSSGSGFLARNLAGSGSGLTDVLKKMVSIFLGGINGYFEAQNYVE